MKKNIYIEILASPGSGNIANAKNIWDAIKNKYEVSILVKGDPAPVNKLFSDGYENYDEKKTYDLRIIPGRELKLGPFQSCSNCATLHFPPPFCKHLFHPAQLINRGADKGIEVDLPFELPFAPISTRALERTKKIYLDYQDLKSKYFPDSNKANIFFIVTYIGPNLCENVKTTVFDNYEEDILILNFGKYSIEVQGNQRVKSIQHEQLTPEEFETCLIECVSIYPVITDGGNTVSAIQALELPYYDLSVKRVLTSPKIAFLNEAKSTKLELFRNLASLEKNIADFYAMAAKTEAYYDSVRDSRRVSRAEKVLLLIENFFVENANNTRKNGLGTGRVA